MRQGKAKYVFPGNNTPQGFLSLYSEGIEGLEQVFILKGGPGVGKSTLMRKIGAAMMERGYDVEFWQCSSDNDSLDGVLIPAISAGVIDGTPPHNMDPKYPGAVEEIFDLGLNWNRELLKGHRKEIVSLTKEISKLFDAAYAKLAEAGTIIEAQAQENAARVDQPRLGQIAAELTEAIYHPARLGLRHLFSTAVTPKGVLSYCESLARTAGNRWYLYGPRGCGKEQIISALAREAEQWGHFAEVYHPSLLPAQIELLLLPDLDTVIVDSGTEPPAYATEADHLVDCSALCGGAAPEPPEATPLIDAAAELIARAKATHDNLEKYYTRAMDFEKVDKSGISLLNRLLAISAAKESGRA
jgi:hypothetical protein